MKAKFNTVNFPIVAMITTCLMAMMLLFAGFSINANAAETPGFNKGADASGKVTIKVVQSSGEFVKGPQVIHVLKATPTTDNTCTVAVGYYYVNENGYLAELPSTLKTVACSDFANNNLTATANKVVSKGTLTITATAVSSKLTLYTGMSSNKVYVNGALYTGYYYGSDHLFRSCTKGVPGAVVTKLMKGTYFRPDQASPLKKFQATGYYVEKGKAARKVIGLKYYNGNFISKGNGWLKLDGKIYCFKNGVAYTGWHKLKSYGKGVKSYKYLFNEKGVLYTNLIEYFGYSKIVHKNTKLIVNKYTHNTTLYYKDGSDYVPVVTFICATARKKGDTPNGTFRLEKTWTKRWFVYTKTNGAPYRYYQWAVHIKGTASLFHSSTYRRTSAASLRPELYNKLGTSCTTHCVRHQAYYAKLIYDIATKTNKKTRVPVQIISSKNDGPFGRVTLKKVSSGTRWDPTDPNK